MTEAELLFTEVLKCDRASLYLDKGLSLNKADFSRVSECLKRRMTGEPLQYILGKQEFMGLEFKVSPSVLIPRPETELLVEAILENVSMGGKRSPRQNVLDIGTGSGCIAVSIAKNLSGVKVTAIDISRDALSVARENADANDVEIEFIKSDIFKSPLLSGRRFDIIVSNPPYIPAGQAKSLQREIMFEPSIALYAGEDGLDLYRGIIKDSPHFLNEGGLLCLEIGFGQADAVKKLLLSGGFSVKNIIKDYAAIDRVVVAAKETRGNG